MDSLTHDNARHFGNLTQLFGHPPHTPTFYREISYRIEDPLAGVIANRMPYSEVFVPLFLIVPLFPYLLLFPIDLYSPVLFDFGQRVYNQQLFRLDVQNIGI